MYALVPTIDRSNTLGFRSLFFLKRKKSYAVQVLACENSQHAATLPLVSPRNDVGEMRADDVSLSIRGGGEEKRSGTEKRCSHNLQSGHPEWWSADNYSIFPTVNILEARIEANRQTKSEMLKKLKKIISCNFVFVAYRICL